MSVPVKQSITQIAEGAIVAPSIANAPNINLENNIDAMLAYLISSISNHFDVESSLTAGLIFYYTGGIYAVQEATYNIIAGNVNLVGNSTNYVQIDYTTQAVIVNQSGWLPNNLPLWELVTLASTIDGWSDPPVINTIVNTAGLLDRRAAFSSLAQPLNTTDSVTFGNLTISAGGALTLVDGIIDINTLNVVDLTTTGDTTIGNANTDDLTVNADATFNNALIANGNSTLTDLIVQGNLTVNGTTSTVNSTTVTVDDPIFTLGGDSLLVSNDAKDRGVEFRWYDTQARLGFMGWDNSASEFIMARYASNSSEVYTAITYGNLRVNTLRSTSIEVTNTVTVTNLNADRVDGIHASSTPTANQLLALNGSSKLDAVAAGADALGGQAPSYYLDGNNFINVYTQPAAVAGVYAAITKIYAGATGINSAATEFLSYVVPLTLSSGTVRVFYALATKDNSYTTRIKFYVNGVQQGGQVDQSTHSFGVSGLNQYGLYFGTRATTNIYNTSSFGKNSHIDVTVTGGDNITITAEGLGQGAGNTQAMIGLDRSQISNTSLLDLTLNCQFFPIYVNTSTGAGGASGEGGGGTN